ncbi:hypothetical protein PMAYCL1PPCAC_14261, partial [Pristionchus mayeri]
VLLVTMMRNISGSTRTEKEHTICRQCSFVIVLEVMCISTRSFWILLAQDTLRISHIVQFVKGELVSSALNYVYMTRIKGTSLSSLGTRPVVLLSVPPLDSSILRST